MSSSLVVVALNVLFFNFFLIFFKCFFIQVYSNVSLMAYLFKLYLSESKLYDSCREAVYLTTPLILESRSV